MASGGAISDLFVLLTAKDAQMLAAFARGGVAGEEMALKIAASMKEVEASLAKTAEATRMVVTAGHEMAISWERDIALMRAETAGLAEGMVAAEAKATASMAKLDAATAAQAKKFSLLGEASGISNKALMGAGVVAAGVGYEFAKMAGDFQQSSTRLVTTAGEDAHALTDVVKPAILAMAGQVGISAQTIVKSMYDVESAGYHGAAGIGVMKAAAQGAVTEQSDLKTATSAVTTALVDYYPKMTDAGQITKTSADIMSKFVETSKNGRLTLEELTQGLHNVAPQAATMGIKLEEVLAILAQMTNHGMSVQQATENMNHAFQKFAGDGTVKMRGSLHAMGIEWQDLQTEIRDKGMIAAMEDISKHALNLIPPGGHNVVIQFRDLIKGTTPALQELSLGMAKGEITAGDFTKGLRGLSYEEKRQGTEIATLYAASHGLGNQHQANSEILKTYSGAIANATGDMTTQKVVIQTTGEYLDKTKNAYKNISAATAEADGSVKGFTEASEGFNVKLAQMKAGFGALAISIGEKLLPVLTPMVGALAAAAKWVAENKVAATAAAFVIGGVLVIALAAAAVAAWSFTAAMLANPITWIVAGVIAAALLIAYAVYEIYKHWAGISKFFKDIWNSIKSAFSAAWDFIKKLFSGIYHDFVDPWVKAWHGVKELFSKSPKEIGTALGEALGHLIRVCIDKAKEMWHGFQDGIINGYHATIDWFHALPGRIKAFLISSGTWLVNEGKKLWHGAQDGVVDAAKATWEWLKALPGRVLDFFKGAPHWLHQAGKDIMSGLWDGIKSMFSSIGHGISDFIGGFIVGVKSGFQTHSPSAVMHSIGSDVMRGLANGINGGKGLLSRIPGEIWQMITGPFANAGNMLVNAGRNVVMGLGNGLKQLAGWLRDTAAWLAGNALSAAKSALGIASPSTLAHEIGVFFAHGLALGIASGSGRAVTAARQMAAQVSGALSGGGAGGMSLNVGTGGFGGGSALAVGGSSGGGGVHVSVNVAGHVWTTDDLVREIQTKLQQHGIRNNNSGINYTFH